MKNFVYADNAATTKMDKEVIESMLPWLSDEYGNASQPYSFARPVKQALRESRETIASCINAFPEEILFTSGGTESDNWALKGTMFNSGERGSLITSMIEHHAILNSALAIEKMGFQVDYLPVDISGTVNPLDLQRIISDRTKLVSIMYSNNEIGTIQPIKELSRIAHENGAVFHTDAVQAVGHVAIDVQDIGVDMLSSSAHKYNGPKGVGFLYVKKGTPLNTFNDGGTQEYGMRAGTENVASIVGMATALKLNTESLIEHAEHIQKLESILMKRLAAASIDFKRNGSDNRIPGNMSLSFKGASGEMLLHRLDLMGICVSTGSACDSKNTQISHVLAAIGLEREYAEGTIRISLGKNNTEEDIERISEALIHILSK